METALLEAIKCVIVKRSRTIEFERSEDDCVKITIRHCNKEKQKVIQEIRRFSISDPDDVIVLNIREMNRNINKAL